MRAFRNASTVQGFTFLNSSKAQVSTRMRGELSASFQFRVGVRPGVEAGYGVGVTVAGAVGVERGGRVARGGDVGRGRGAAVGQGVGVGVGVDTRT